MKSRSRGDTLVSVLVGVALLSVVIVASVQGSAGMQLISANMRQILQGGMVSLDVAEVLKARAQAIAASNDSSSAKLGQLNGFVNALRPKLALLGSDNSDASVFEISVSAAQLVDSDFAQLTLGVSWNSTTGQMSSGEGQTIRLPLVAVNSGGAAVASTVEMLGWSDLSSVDAATQYAPDY